MVRKPTGYTKHFSYGNRTEAKKSVKRMSKKYFYKIRKMGYRTYTVFRRKKPS